MADAAPQYRLGPLPRPKPIDAERMVELFGRANPPGPFTDEHYEMAHDMAIWLLACQNVIQVQIDALNTLLPDTEEDGAVAAES